MSFTFRVKGGSLYSIVMEMREIELKASEESIRVEIDKSHLLDSEPYIVVTCQDDQKGMILMERVEREAPRFIKM